MSLESHLTERQFFLFSLSGILLLVLVMFFGLLRPRMRERAEKRIEVENLTRQLQTSGYLLGEGTLLKKKQLIETEVRELFEEWDILTGRLSSFANQEQWRSGDVANIDYKFYLYLTRNRLRGKAREQRIDVPALLGLPDELESNDVARERMLQLLAVEKLVDTAIEYGIANIRQIDPLPPIVHSLGPSEVVYMEEYPLRVIFEGPMPRLYRLWEAMFQPNRSMLLRNIAMEKTSLRNPDEVRMTATLSSFLFLEGARTMNPNQGRAVMQTKARGH